MDLVRKEKSKLLGLKPEWLITKNILNILNFFDKSELKNISKNKME